MKIKINWQYVKGEPDTDDMKMLCLPAREVKGERDAELSFKVSEHTSNFCFADIHTGDRDSSNLLCKEIAKRWNEYPKLIAEIKRLKGGSNE